jgi:transposase-like protein
MKNKHKKPTQEARSPREWTTEEKLKAVVTAAELSGEEFGAFLRREGLHEAQLQEWRDALQAALDPGKRKKGKRASSEAKRVKQLEKELRRKDKALAEVTALLVLQKKMQAFWEAKEGGTQKTSDE